MVQEYDYPGAGRVKALGNPVKLSRSPARLAKGAPRLGEDNDAVLGELGLDAAEIAALRAGGAYERAPMSDRAFVEGGRGGPMIRSVPGRKPRIHRGRLHRSGGPDHRRRDDRGGRERLAVQRAAGRSGQLRDPRAQLERPGQLRAARHARVPVHRGRERHHRPPLRRPRLHDHGQRADRHRRRGVDGRGGGGVGAGRRGRARPAGRGGAGGLAGDGRARQARAQDERGRARGHPEERRGLLEPLAARLPGQPERVAGIGGGLEPR